MTGISKDNLAANIRAARARKGISQGELAEAINVYITTVSAYERGEIVPGADKIFSMAEVLDVTPNELMGWTKVS